MDLLALSIFSIFMAIFGSYESVPLTAIHPAYDFPERFWGAFKLSWTMCQVGTVISMVFPPRYLNGSLIDPGGFITTLPSAAPTETITTALSVIPAPISSDIVNDLSIIQTENPGTAESSEGRTRVSIWVVLLRVLLGYFSPEDQERQRQSSFVDLLLNPFWVLSMVGPFAVMRAVVQGLLLFKRREYTQTDQVADDEILGIVREIRVKKAELLKKLDEELSVVDAEVSDVSMRIKAERERICIELASLRVHHLIQDEVVQVRKSVESRFQCELEGKVKELIAELDLTGSNTVLSERRQEFSTQTDSQPESLKEPLHGESSLVDDDQLPLLLENGEEQGPSEETGPSPQLGPSNDVSINDNDNDDPSPFTSPESSPKFDRKRRCRPSKAKRMRMAKRVQNQQVMPSLIPSPLRLSQ